ncbi:MULTISPECIES: hypothetical protein [unclassified Paraburkholderia]|uniref:hypothetical protein n=1 Tax=unclassified Paraburkholderia TaxID=2615204 RepID=UPI002AB0FE7B|nr:MULTISPECIES: hypothetical protein [unclassified Paraburkholderia]
MSDLNNIRVSYKSIKADVLDLYFTLCRDRAIEDGWSHREVLGSIDCEFDGVFDLRVENIMLSVIRLILSGGWSSDSKENLSRYISEQIAMEGLENILRGIPSEEAELFKHDLKILKFI